MAWTDFILPTAIAGLTYADYKNKKKKQKQLEKQYGAWRAAQIAKDIQGSGGGGHGGGGGGGSGRAGSILGEHFAQAQSFLNPFIEAGLKSLPQQTELYGKGLQGASGFTGQALDPEFLRAALNYNAPKQAELPAYLRGGAK